MDVLLLAPGPGVATRVPVLACRDALRKGADVEVLELDSDSEVDAAVKRASVDGARLVVAGGDGQLRAVLRRMVRRSLPRGGERPADLPSDRTVPDLPAIGVLPLEAHGDADLAAKLGLPRTPADVAAAVLEGAERRVDLLRHDGGSVTLHGALLGGADTSGRPVAWHARIDVDDTLLTDGTEPLLACAIANADGYTDLSGLPLVVSADPADGVLEVGLALPAAPTRGLFGRRRAHGEIEVRRARGRAVSLNIVTNTAEDAVPLIDDGVSGTVTRKRTWWMERGAWGVYTR
ncbi:diacylglycerol kinase family protein [Cryptosporangium aurantiacum]|uniref:Diacylglycerol kinase catalytic domain-containing protein n=1 Tax=Cryptosporangium aurantiacum TaxID=134849 RepID=A0A1M7RD75_9ACTN|nr:diacylglycerol kinase family protein [Cryptosporangium aurantiacum]SHN44176.1 Diacylglycerol kinase catalytic domain-containing protein [Cryptosporangium aurantiacum]